MDTLTIIQILSALSFIILTVSETIVLAANGWKVDKHKTPAYHIISSSEFCKAFWGVVGTYFMSEFLTAVGFAFITAYIIGCLDFINGNISGYIGLSIAVTFLIVLFTLLHFIPKLFSKVFKSKPVKAVQQTKLSQGIYNWYHQFKNKYCPILERD